MDPEAIRDEKVKALQAIKPLSLDTSHAEVAVVFIQKPGYVKAIGYLEEDGGQPILTETYAALCLQLDN